MASTIHSDETLNNIHVFMVSFPGQGHVNPLLRLGKRLAYSGLFITLSTPESIGSKIQEANNITDDEPVRFGRGMLRFEFFHDGWDINDPRRIDLDAYMAQLELVGRVKLPEMIRKHETGRPVSCLINNPFIPWVSDVAEGLGIPSAMLWVQSCACFSAYYHFHHNLVPFPSENELEIDVKIPCMPVLRYDEIPSFLHPRSPYGFLGRAVLGQFKNLKKPFCILMDTFHELEHEIIEYMEELISTPIKTIGPLFKLEKSIGVSNSIRVDFLPPENNCIQWLDSKPPQTVVYISFGSIVHLKQEQIDEIAYGLSNSEVSFLWVLRPPDAVPLGFLDEIGDKGKIVRWGPQEEVLAHASISCFVTHCGWNSTVEAVASGVPVAAFPQWGDQVTDAKFLVDVFRVGIRVSRGEDEGRVVSREEVERCLRAATGGKEAARMKENAVKWKKAAEVAVADGGSSCKNMQDFLDEVVRIGRKLN